MKIGFVLDDGLDKPDGVQQYILTLGEWMALKGHEVHYLVGRTLRKDLSNVHSLSRNFTVKFNQNKMSTPLPVATKKIRKLLREQKFDVLHVQLPYSPLLAGKIIANAPKTTAIVGTFHILPSSKLESVATKILSLLVHRTKNKFDKVISVSTPAQEFCENKFGLKSTVIPNAVALDKFESKGRRKFKSNKIQILYLGRLVKRKGCMFLLRSLDYLNQNKLAENIEVTIAGRGEQMNKLRNYVNKSGLDKIVNFTGFVDENEKNKLLARSEIAVMPSTGGESFGIILIEAMASGTEAIIVGDNPGYRSVMVGHEDQIVDARDTAALAKTIHHFVINKSARTKAAKWQFSRVKKYDVNIIGKQILDIYKDALRIKQSMR